MNQRGRVVGAELAGAEPESGRGLSVGRGLSEFSTAHQVITTCEGLTWFVVGTVYSSRTNGGQ